MRSEGLRTAPRDGWCLGMGVSGGRLGRQRAERLQMSESWPWGGMRIFSRRPRPRAAHGFVPCWSSPPVSAAWRIGVTAAARFVDTTLERQRAALQPESLHVRTRTPTGAAGRWAPHRSTCPGADTPRSFWLRGLTRDWHRNAPTPGPWPLAFQPCGQRSRGCAAAKVRWKTGSFASSQTHLAETEKENVSGKHRPLPCSESRQTGSTGLCPPRSVPEQSRGHRQLVTECLHLAFHKA